MRIARFQSADGQVRHGIVREGEVQVIEVVGGPKSRSCPSRPLFGAWKETRQRLPLKEVKLLAPLSPVNILCLGRNYKAHADESDASVPQQPLLFIKATSSVIGPEEPIVIPRAASCHGTGRGRDGPDHVDYEAELAVVIKKPAKHVKEAEALDYVLGYTCANDVSARDCQANDGQWSRAKSFDAFCPLGPWIETELDPADLRVRGRLNGKTMQDARTSLMIFSVRFLISYLSAGMTLLPGTVIMTGTPAGVGFARKPPVWLKPGDAYEVDIEGIGVLRNPVVAEK